jgi:D-amino-acid dehydrogenase
MKTKSATVIGAGIAGLTAAYYLARKNYNVTVLEQERYPAMRTSYANGGQISVSNSEVWTTWNNVQKGFKWILKKDAPLSFRPRFDWRMWSWLARFVFHTARGDYKKNTADTIKLGIQSRKLYQEIIQEEGLEFDQLDSGIVHFYKDSKYLSNAQKVETLYESHGCEWDLLDSVKFYNIDPALKDIKGVLGGAWTPSDWTGDIHKFCLELENRLRKKYNVNFEYNYFVDNLDSINDDIIVVASGVGSSKLAESINDTLPIYPVKGYSITINANDEETLNALPKVSLLDDQAKIVTSTLGNRFRVAGTAELAGENYDIRRDRIQPLLDWVHTNFPKINTHDYSSWACLRPMTPNMMPIVRRSLNNDRVYYHTGHGHLGWTLSPATAKNLVELIEND